MTGIFSFNRYVVLLGFDMEKDAYEESLKSYRDNINVIDTARQEGREEEKLNIARALLDILDDEIIAMKTGLAKEKVAWLRCRMSEKQF